jgi:uncharacterized protein
MATPEAGGCTMTGTSMDSNARARAGAAQRFRGRYLSITSFKRDGTPVATPVWFAERDGTLLVETDAASGKVKRIRHDPAVCIAICTASGRIRGEQIPAVVKLLPDSEIRGAERLIKQKYWADLIIIGPLRLIQSVLHLGRPRTASVILSITPES